MTEGSDIGFTHIALICQDAEATIDFYRRYAGLTLIHDRQTDQAGRVFWMSDLRRHFAIVFIEAECSEMPLGPMSHLGVCLESRAEVDRLVALARLEGRETTGPEDDGPPVGYWAFIQDPDGHTLEISYGQNVELAVNMGRAGKKL